MRTQPHPVVGIPVKPFGVAKQRLHLRLDPATRSILGRRIAARTAAAAAGAGVEVIIVTGDSGVRRWAGDLGLRTIAEPEGTGLNGAAAALRDQAIRAGRSWLVIHADLPLISPTEVGAMLEPLRNGGTVIAPSHDGGTSALGGFGHVDFRYGIGSFQRHLRQVPTAAVIVRPGLAFDLDTVEDLDGILGHPHGDWIKRLLAAIDSPT
jgi:2-phospho-L-lactate guanylyltransferase